MKREWIGIAAALFWSGAASAGPVALSDDALGAITAGSAGEMQGSGGAIVGNNSTGSITQSGIATIDSNAQSGAEALNLVNSSESTVANGVNIWDGDVSNSIDAAAGANFEVNQSNAVMQEQRRVASVPNYNRPEANEWQVYDESGSSSSTQSASSDVTNVSVVSREISTTSSSTGSVDTQSSVGDLEVQGGRGLAGAGELLVDFEGGDAVTLNIGAGLGPDGDVISGEITLTLGLPAFTVDMDGAGCAVIGGSCEATGDATRSEADLDDFSTMSVTDSSSSSSEEYASVGESRYNSAFELSGAQAEYIVVDESELSVDSVYEVILSGEAQSNVRGLNIVNASGSAVANGVNIARTRTADLVAGSGNLLTLNQVNNIVHSK